MGLPKSAIDSMEKDYQFLLSQYWPVVLQGITAVVDPASGGTNYSSKTAVSLIRGGQLEFTTSITPPPHLNEWWQIPQRLRYISAALRAILPPIDLLVVERTWYEPDEKTNMSMFQKVHMTAGAVYASLPGYLYYIGMPAHKWKEIAPPGYEKSDEGDAELMARVLIRDAEALSNPKPSRKSKASRRKKS